VLFFHLLNYQGDGDRISNNLVSRLLSALATKYLNVFHKSNHATLGRWYSTDLTWSDLNKRQITLFTEY
jgi:hypothetical protein